MTRNIAPFKVQTPDITPGTNSSPVQGPLSPTTPRNQHVSQGSADPEATSSTLTFSRHPAQKNIDPATVPHMMSLCVLASRRAVQKGSA